MSRSAVLVAVVFCVSGVLAEPAVGTIECKDTSHRIDRAQITLEKEGERVYIQLYKPGETDYFASMTVDVKKSTDGKTTGRKPEFYHLYANCPETQYNINRSVGTGFGDHDDFRKFTAQLKKGGKVQLQVSGIEEMFDGLTWNLELEGKVE